MNSSQKFYKLAMKRYQVGRIEEALVYCERSISENLRNAAALNLKGLLLYIKGNLELAINTWKINEDLNKDIIAKKYIADAAGDEKRIYIYEDALKLIDEFRIKEAMMLLNQCTKSDFNLINVSNAIAVCLITQGKYEEARSYIEKALSFDSDNRNALEQKTILINYGVLKKNINYKSISLWISSLIIVFVTILLGIENKSIINDVDVFKKLTSGENVEKKQNKQLEKDIDTLEQVGKQQSVDTELSIESQAQNSIEQNEDTKEQEENKKYERGNGEEPQQKFSYSDVKKALEDKNFEELYDLSRSWNKEDMKVNDKELIGRVEDLLEIQGVEYFYNEGRNLIKQDNLKGAVQYFLKAYNYGKKHYLYPYIIFILGDTSEKLGDVESGIKYYDQYYSKYLHGDHSDLVLYKLALIYEKIDIKKAKEYANKLSEDFPKSMYNNSIIKDIIGNK
jgi:tetratricopeptide (TPR) repeat protein